MRDKRHGTNKAFRAEHNSILQALFDQQARLYDVYPLRGDLDARISARLRRPLVPRSHYTYRGNNIRVAWSEQPRLAETFSLTVRFAADGPANGAFLATGSALGGWAFAVEDGVPVVVHTASSSRYDRFEIRADEPLPEDATQVRFVMTPDEPRPFSPGVMSIYAGERLIGSGAIDRVGVITMGPGETMDVGNDTGRRVMHYPAGPAFTGEVEELVIELGR